MVGDELAEGSGLGCRKVVLGLRLGVRPAVGYVGTGPWGVVAVAVGTTEGRSSRRLRITGVWPYNGRTQER